MVLPVQKTTRDSAVAVRQLVAALVVQVVLAMPVVENDRFRL